VVFATNPIVDLVCSFLFGAMRDLCSYIFVFEIWKWNVFFLTGISVLESSSIEMRERKKKKTSKKCVVAAQ